MFDKMRLSILDEERSDVSQSTSWATLGPAGVITALRPLLSIPPSPPSGLEKMGQAGGLSKL